MASKGICCAAQAAGDLGKPLVITVHRKDGTTYQRCGTCEIVPSCRTPQKRVFAFRFLASADCGIVAAKCGPTAAGIAQYNAEVGRARVAGQPSLLEQAPTFPASGLPLGSPYQLPLS